jgi:hypothetical protein
MTDKNRTKTPINPQKTDTPVQADEHHLTIEDLGWTPEQAAQLRAQFGIFAEDWDDTSMDVYDDL